MGNICIGQNPQFNLPSINPLKKFGETIRRFQNLIKFKSIIDFAIIRQRIYSASTTWGDTDFMMTNESFESETIRLIVLVMQFSRFGVCDAEVFGEILVDFDDHHVVDLH
jgi:hypothetical protein